MNNKPQFRLSGKRLLFPSFYIVCIFSFVAVSSFNAYSQNLNFNHPNLTSIVSLPWWKTWWAYLIYGMLFMTIFYLVRRYELNRIRLKNQLRLEKIETDSLRNMDRLKSQFFANISHEFRTPLTLILGQIESIISARTDTREIEKLQVIDRNARKLLLMINQILDLSKLDAGKMELSRSRHDIVAFLRGLFFSFESLAARKRITLVFESKPGGIQVIIDPDKIEKTFYNLFSNAVKFTDANGKVTVNIMADEPNFVEIRVENSGQGIPAEQLPHIFDRFYQVDILGKRNHEGTGIGLALAKELVELHRGTISVNSVEGISTVFTVRFPTYEALPGSSDDLQPSVNTQFYQNLFSGDEMVKPEIHEEEADDSPGDARAIVLIVEDNTDVRDFIRGQLKDEYLVKEAENGLLGIAVAQEAVPDLIISDLMMPVMDGYQFCKEIRRDIRTSHIPVIMLTARADIDDKIEGLETGIDDFITKPFSTKELKVRIRNLIEQRRLLRARFSRETRIKPSEVTATSIDKIFLDKIIKAVESNFENQDFTVETLAGELNMSTSQLNRKLNALIGQPAGQLMRSMRLQRAADMLEKQTGSVAQIGYQLGFNDQAYFSRAFRKQFGCSPGEYKKERKVQGFA